MTFHLYTPDHCRNPVGRPWMPRDYASKGWCRPEWADLSAQDIAPERRETDRPAEFGPLSFAFSDRVWAFTIATVLVGFWCAVFLKAAGWVS